MVERLKKEVKVTMFQCSICGGNQQCDCGSCAVCSVAHDGRIHNLLENIARLKAKALLENPAVTESKVPDTQAMALVLLLAASLCANIVLAVRLIDSRRLLDKTGYGAGP